MTDSLQSHLRSLTRANLTLLLLVAVPPAAFAQSKVEADERTLGAEIPRVIEKRAMEPDELPRAVRTVEDLAVEVILDRQGWPFALLAEESFGELPEQNRRALAWANAARTALGLDGYELRPASAYTSGEERTMEFALYRDGLAVLDGKLALHWEGARFQGATVSGPRQLALADEAPAPDDIERVLVPYGRASGRTDLVLATVERSGRTTTYRPRQRPPFQVITHGPIQQHPGVEAALAALPHPPQTEIDVAPRFQQWTPPTASFPDQISLDAQGNPWFSVPGSNYIVKLRRQLGTWDLVSTGTGTAPDGLVVDASDEVWYGEFNTVRLGRYNPATGQSDSYAPPVNASNIAVPQRMSSGHIIVTDHGGWLLEFDPATETWVHQNRTLAGSPHLVVASEDVVNQQLVMTQFSARRLGFRPLAGGSIVDAVIPGVNEPAFIEVAGGISYFSIWNRNRLGAYDPSTGQFTFHVYPLSLGETGGPMDVTPSGDVVSGTRGNGFITVFRPATQEFDVWAIPSSNPGLKDGLRVAEDGVVWFTESGANLVSRIIYLR